MSGFTFGSNIANQQGQTGGFSFGAPKSTVSAAAPAFGTPAQTTLPTFGATTTTPAFGAPAATPVFGAQTAAPAFGAPAATPAFGTPAATPAFGVPTATPGFGAPAATPAFGVTSTAAPAFGTVAPTFRTTAPAFGATTAVKPTFGVPSTATPAFGTTTAALPAFGALPTSTSFGALPTTTPAFGVSTAAPAFGTITTSSVAAPAFGTSTLGITAPTFGTPAAAPATTGFSFGTSTIPTLGAQSVAPTVATTSTLPTFGLGSNVAATTTAFSFGTKPAATTTIAPTTSVGLSFGTTTSASTLSLGGSGTLGGGLFGKPATTTATGPAPFVGLGGADLSVAQPATGNSNENNVKVKETQVPDEISKTVDELKTYIKQQKTISSDIGRTSTTKLSSVTNEVTNLQWGLQEISNAVQANYNQIKLLRRETNRTLQSVEMAQRTQDTPSGLQYENTAPLVYFQNLIAKYEKDLCSFREQIVLTERHMVSLANPQIISPADLKRGFQQLNESFISLAGRLHEIHQKVEQQKEQYLNLRKYRLRDSTNVFAQIDHPENEKEDICNITSGPTPFSNITAMNSFSKTHTSHQTGSSSVAK